MALTDVHMPEMDGFDLVRRIQEKPELTKAVILMLTSGERGGDLARCRQLGISAYLTKPVRRSDLYGAITAAIAARSPLAGVAEPAPDVASPEHSRKSECDAAGLQILLVEDNLVNQRLAVRILEKAGHRVTTAGNGKIALQILEEQSVDLVLMDVQMPEMDGFEATGLIREKEQRSGEHLPIIAMTAHAMRGDRERCLTAGMDDYITKPIASAALLEMVAAMAARPKQ